MLTTHITPDKRPQHGKHLITNDISYRSMPRTNVRRPDNFQSTPLREKYIGPKKIIIGLPLAIIFLIALVSKTVV